MADRYWRGITDTWTVTSAWSATDGGASVGVIPTRDDDVFFTTSSNFSGFPCRVANNECRNLTIDGWTSQFSVATPNPVIYGIRVYGNLLVRNVSDPFNVTSLGNTDTSLGYALGFNGNDCVIDVEEGVCLPSLAISGDSNICNVKFASNVIIASTTSSIGLVTFDKTTVDTNGYNMIISGREGTDPSFGHIFVQQDANIHFRNSLVYSPATLIINGNSSVYMEDSRCNIGWLNIPNTTANNVSYYAQNSEVVIRGTVIGSTETLELAQKSKLSINWTGNNILRLINTSSTYNQVITRDQDLGNISIEGQSGWGSSIYFSNSVNIVGTFSMSPNTKALSTTNLVVRMSDFKAKGTSGNLINIFVFGATSTSYLNFEKFDSNKKIKADYLALRDSRANGTGWFAGVNSVNVNSKARGWQFTNGGDTGSMFNVF